jgi:SRSO17 transposase
MTAQVSDAGEPMVDPNNLLGESLMTSDQVASLAPALSAFVQPFRAGFPKITGFRHLTTYMLGLLSDLPRKSIEPIALASGTAPRTLQEFLADYPWDDARLQRMLLRQVADRPGASGGYSGGGGGGIGVIDESAHAKRGPKTPGAQRQYCGESGKIDNCTVGVHLVYTDNAQENPFSCAIASDLYLPQSWIEDPALLQEARVPESAVFRPKWQIALDLVKEALGQGIRMEYLTFDEEYGKVPAFWRELDSLGQKAIGEVPKSFLCWATLPKYRSLQKPFAAHRVDDLAAHSPAFCRQEWQTIRVKDTTRGALLWQVRWTRVHLPEQEGRPSERSCWLIVAYRQHSGGGSETKYFLSNAPAGEDLLVLLRAAFARWHVEKWFERSKQESGLGDFEVRTYRSLIRHWLIARLAMLFLAEQTTLLRGEKPQDHLRAGGQLLQAALGEDAGDLVAFVDGPDAAVPLPSASQRGQLQQPEGTEIGRRFNVALS